MSMLSRTIACAVLFIITACTESDSRCVRLPYAGHYCLQSTTALAAFDSQQIVEVFMNGRKETLIIEMESDKDGLRLAVLTPFGHKILQMHYDNRIATLSTSPNPNLPPTLLASIIQLTLWPAEAVRIGLGEGMSIEEHGNTRRILFRGDTVLLATRIGTKPPYEQINLSIPALESSIHIKNLRTLETTGKEP